MATIYVSKTDDANAYAKLGYDISTEAASEEGHIVVFKKIIVPKDNDFIKEIVRNFNGPWSTVFSKKGYCDYFKSKGIKFEEIYSEDSKNGKKKVVVMDESFYRFICDWRIEVDLSDDKYITFTSGDYYFHFPYFCDAEKAIEKYCGPEIKELLTAGLVEKAEVAEK